MDEAARFRGYTQSTWEREPVTMRARVLAHYLEHGLREGYQMEQAEESAKKGNDKKATAPDEFWKFRQSVKKAADAGK